MTQSGKVKVWARDWKASKVEMRKGLKRVDFKQDFSVITRMKIQIDWEMGS